MMTRQPTPQQRGFTMIELMVTIAILGIMAAIALPSMNNFINKQRVANRAEQTANLFRFARSEAVRLNTPVIVCYTTIRADGKANVPCTPAAATAQNGFTAFISSNGILPYNTANDEVLRTVAINQNGGNNHVSTTVRHFRFNEQVNSGANGNIWIFYPNGSFGYTDSNTGSVRGNQITVGSGLIRMDFDDAMANDAVTQEYRRSKIILDGSGRVSTCLPTDTRPICTYIP